MGQKVKNKCNRYILMTLLTLNLLILLLKYLFDITLYYDWCEEALWVIWILMAINGLGKSIHKVTSILFLVLSMLVGYCGNADIHYRLIHSPNNKHHVILKEYSDVAIHHHYYTIEVHKQVGWIFKWYTGKKIYVYDNPVFIEGEMTYIGLTRYKVDYNLYFEWLNNNCLHIYCNHKQMRKDEILDITVDFKS